MPTFRIFAIFFTSKTVYLDSALITAVKTTEGQFSKRFSQVSKFLKMVIKCFEIIYIKYTSFNFGFPLFSTPYQQLQYSL